MQNCPVEVLIVPSKRRPCCKRPADTWEENQQPCKRQWANLLVCPMERKVSLPPENSKCSSSRIDMPVTSSCNCPTAEPLPIYQPKEAACGKDYDPLDFTSDELNPAYEWLRNTSSVEKCDVHVMPLIRSILRLFPLGLRLNKLEAMVWRKYKIHLFKLSLDQGYRDSFHLLEAMPGITLKFQHTKPFQCLVQLDPAGGKVSH